MNHLLDITVVRTAVANERAFAVGWVILVHGDLDRLSIDASHPQLVHLPVFADLDLERRSFLLAVIPFSRLTDRV